MDKRKKAGVRFNEDLYINFIYDEDSNTIECYRNGVLINGGITPEELMHILENYATKAELSAVEAEIPDVTNLATKAELSAVEAEIPDVTNLATKAELSAVEAEIPDVTNLATKAELSAVEAEIPIVESGNISSGGVEPASYNDVNITFTKTFSSEPQISLCLLTASGAVDMGNMIACVTTVSSTGFTARIFNNGTTRKNPTVKWLAIL